MKDYAKQLIKENTIFDTISRQEEVFWLNDKCLPFDMIDGLCQLVVSDKDIQDAEARLSRFAPFIKSLFPGNRSNGWHHRIAFAGDPGNAESIA